MQQELKVLIEQHITADPAYYTTVDCLADRLLATILRIVPESDPVSDDDAKALRYALHWLLHIAGEGGRILRLRGLEDRVLSADTREQMSELASASSSIVLHTYVLISGETGRNTSVFIEAGERIPHRFTDWIETELDKPNTRFDEQDMRIRRRGTESVASVENPILASMMDLSKSLLVAFEWLADSKRPPRRQIRRCLKYMHAWALELTSCALLVPLLEQECYSNA